MPSMPNIDEWSERDRLNLEKEALGFYISGHPLDQYQDLIEKFTNANALTIGEVKDMSAVRIGGTISSLKTIRTKKGDLMAFVNLEDMHGAVEAVIFPNVYEAVSEFLVTDFPILIQGEVQKDEKGVKLLAESVVPMEKAEETWTASVHISVRLENADKTVLEKLHSILKGNPGSCTGYIHLVIPGATETVLQLPEELKLRVTEGMIREINGLLGYPAVDTVCSEATLAPKKKTFYGNKKKKLTIA
jgi:DNA polymerase-3 subunit alpha